MRASCGRRKGWSKVYNLQIVDVSTTRIVIRSQFALLKAVWRFQSWVVDSFVNEEVSIPMYPTALGYIPVVVCGVTKYHRVVTSVSVPVDDESAVCR